MEEEKVLGRSEVEVDAAAAESRLNLRLPIGDHWAPPCRVNSRHYVTASAGWAGKIQATKRQLRQPVNLATAHARTDAQRGPERKTKIIAPITRPPRSFSPSRLPHRTCFYVFDVPQTVRPSGWCHHSDPWALKIGSRASHQPLLQPCKWQRIAVTYATADNITMMYPMGVETSLQSASTICFGHAKV